MNYTWLGANDTEFPEFYHWQEDELKAHFNFALCIPSTYIDNFMNQVKKEIRRDLIDDYLIPLLTTTFMVSVFIIWQLKRLSIEIT